MSSSCYPGFAVAKCRPSIIAPGGPAETVATLLYSNTGTSSVGSFSPNVWLSNSNTELAAHVKGFCRREPQPFRRSDLDCGAS